MTALREVVETLFDPTRGRRRLWRDAHGRPLRLELADGTVLTIDRDDADGHIRVACGDQELIDMATPVVVPALLRHLGLDPAQARDPDGSHRLHATDPAGTTRTEAGARSIRIERGGDVLRIDTDDSGRPRRVTAPGGSDLLYRWDNGVWAITRLDGTELMRIEESPGRTVFRVGDRAWIHARARHREGWSMLDGSSIVDTRCDLAGRITSRHWHGGSRHDFERDELGRLVRWRQQRGEHVRTQERCFSEAGELCAIVDDGIRTEVETDEGGRIRSLSGPSRAVTYEYDANGRRTARVAGSGERTTYRYDPLGQLVEFRGELGVTRCAWDALGRRTSVTVDDATYREHRDGDGRLWSVTDDAGTSVASFIWWDGRVIARCGVDGRLEEFYLTDTFGSLIGVAAANDGWLTREAIQPPHGEVHQGAGWRPTVFGHIADGHTPLIPFGARELDPETGAFLTPDPWHHADDDPRVLAGAANGLEPRELPAARVHPYALSQHDPLGRPDYDGHFAWGNFFLTLVLGPTWGAALTSLSLFLFAPLNIYFEVIGLFGYFGGRHAWPQHSIFGLRGLSGSTRLGTAALALNGFFPRAMAGVGGDRCMTIGHVVWESRHYFHMLDRACVLELDDISGTPRPDGTPSYDGRRFSATTKGSILAITSTDTDNRQWVHASWWTRGPGNAVGLRAGTQTLEDHVAAGTAHARGAVYLAAPMPTVMPTPRSDDDRATLKVDEYVVAGGQNSDARLVPEVWFAFEVALSDGIAAHTVLGVTHADLPAAFGEVLTTVPGPNPVAILDHALPARMQTADVRKGVKLQKFTTSSITSGGWVTRPGSTTNKQLDLAAPAHPVAVGDVVKLAPASGAPAERPNAYCGVEKVAVGLTMSPTLGGAVVNGATVFALTADGTAANGTFASADPTKIRFTAAPPFRVDDIIQAGTGANARYARVQAVAEAVAAGPPGPGGAAGTPAVPASITVDESLAGLTDGPVRVARLKKTNADTDKGTITAQAADVLTVDVKTTALLPVNSALLIDSSPAHVRAVSAVGTVGIDLVDELVGTGSFTLTKMTADGSTISSKVSSARFVEFTGTGDPPSAYPDWPQGVMGLVPKAQYDPSREPSGWRYFLKAASAPATMHPDFHDYWQPVTVAGHDYWLLSSELKIVKDGSDYYWEPDFEDDHPRRHRQKITPNASGQFDVTVTGFVRAATPVTRPDAGGGKVFAFAAEAQVPEEPTARWTLADALADHELTHTLQNTYWGPLLGALPLQGAFRTVRDVLVANDVNRDDVKWMDWHPFAAAGASGFEDSNWFEIASIGGLMQIIWSFVILGPALPDEGARNAILSTNFEDWSAVFNPVNQALINLIPTVQNDVPESHDWKVVLGRALTRALDLRAWTPLMGFIKLMLPDGPRNFLEQQASRKSGDLYSSLLTVNDRFNATLALAPNKTDANLTSALGGAVRLMGYHTSWYPRNTVMDACDSDGSHLTTYLAYDSSGWARDITRLESTGSQDVLLPQDLYEPVGAAPPTLQVDGPPGVAGAPATMTFWKAPTGTVMRPRLQSIVPIPPRVWRSVGFFLVAASPATWKATLDDGSAYTVSEDAHTAEATITVESTVKLGSDDIPFDFPAATGSAPGATILNRFITETQPLTVVGRDTSTWEAHAAPGVTLARRASGQGWDLTANPAPTLPANVRIRIWARLRPTDASSFDLVHPDAPTLAGKRSYLREDLWIPVRDFLLKVEDLPPLTGGAMSSTGSCDITLPIKVSGQANIVPAGDLLVVSRVGDQGRGETWKFTVRPGKIVESTQTVRVVARYAAGVERAGDITVNPAFTLDAAGFDVTPAAPLALTINGGSESFEVVEQPPASSRARVAISGRTVTVTISAPAAGAPASPPVPWQLKVRDSTGAMGGRSLRLRP